MQALLGILSIAATFSIGLLVGALLTEGVLLMPYWRALSAVEFYALHKDFGPRLYAFYAPLTITATSLAMLAAIAAGFRPHPGGGFTILAGVLSAALVAIYGLYFKAANARLASGNLGAADLAIELTRWAYWHWARVGIGLVTFGASLLGLRTAYTRMSHANVQ